MYKIIIFIEILGCRDPKYKHEYLDLDKGDITDEAQSFNRKV